MWAWKRPRIAPRPAVAVVDVGAVRVALFVGEGVVLAVVGDPGDHRALDRRRAEDRQQAVQPGLRLEGAVGEVAVEADRDPEPGEDVHADEEEDVAPVQGAAPDLPAGEAERDEGDQRDQAGDDPVARLVGDRLDVGWKWADGRHRWRSYGASARRLPDRHAGRVMPMPFASTAPLRREIEARIPERPFTIEFWDGTRLPVDRRRRPDLLRPLAARRRPRAARAGPARPRPRLRQRRDRGRRHRRGDRAARQLAAALARRRRQAGAAARRGARRRADASRRRARRPSCAPAAAATARSATPAPSATTTTSPTSSSSSSSAPTMVYSCAIFARRRAKTLEEAQEEKLETVARKLDAEGGRPRARRRLRLGRLPALGGDQARRQRRRHHPLPAAGREGAAAGRGGRRRRPGRDPRHGLPRPPGRRALRRDRQHRHGRARRRRPDRRLRARPWPACSSPAGACSTTASPASATPTPRPAPSPSATSSPTPRRCTSRASCWRWNGRASSPATSRTSAPTTPRRCATGPSNLDDNLDEAIRLAGPERVRVWRLYLRAARNGFENGFTSIYQARCELADRPQAGKPDSTFRDCPVGAGLAAAPRRGSCRWRRRRP